MKTKKIIMALITLASLVITIFLWFAVNRSEAEYSEVEVTVESSRTVTRRKGTTTTTIYEVKVKYNGETYDLNNCHNSYSYTEGKKVTAYLANGKLYANVEGVKTSTPLATAYFVFLFATFGMIIGFPVYLAQEKNKRNA